MSNELGDTRASERSGLRAAIADLLDRHSGRLTEPKESALAKLAANMPGHDGGERRPGKDYDLVAELLAGELQSPEPISLRRARDGAWCLWETKPAIAYAEPLLGRYLKQLLDFADKRASRALCNAYLVQYEERRPGLKQVSQALEKLAAYAEAPYAELHHTLKLFSLPEGPDRLGQKSLARRQTPMAVLKEHGLSSAQLLQGGFVEPCALAALEKVAADCSLEPRERLNFVMALALDGKTGQLFFKQHKAAFANALLMPYASSNPPPDVQTDTLAALLRAIGDPRSRAAEWRSMEEAARIARRWLTKESINQFLDVVDAVAEDRMWRWRRKFWNAVFDTKGGDGQSIVQEAWVVFDAVGYNQAKRMGLKEISAGRFRNSSVEKGKSVLLLRIGRMVIAEWSHNGSVRIWYDADKKGAPQLYNAHYTTTELIEGTGGYPPNWGRGHTGAATYKWQDAVADQLAERTKIRIPRSKYQ